MAGPRDFAHTFAAADTVRFNVAGRYLHVVRAPAAAVFVSLDEASELERIAGEGIYISEGFKLVTVRSAVAQTVRLMVADEPQVSGGGTGTTATLPSSTQEVPSTTIATPAADAILTATALTIAANLARRRITLMALSTNTGSVFVQAVGAGNGRGIELVPGVGEVFRTTAALDVRNASGATQTIMRFEESGP